MGAFEWLAQFVAERSALELFAALWYFLVFDFVRYVVLDGVLMVVHLFSRWRVLGEKAAARSRMMREAPLVSVIAPGKNEGRHIPELVRSLREQTYRNIEIIIVDDGSDDDTPIICRGLERKGLIDRFFRNDVRGGKASAANLALRYCRGQFIVHVDADSHLRHDSVEKIIIPFYWRPRIGAVAGDIRVRNANVSIAAALQGIEYMKGISVGRAVNAMLGILRIVSGAYGAFRRDILDRLKGWDVGPGLDGDITLKIRKLHYDVYFEPDAVCFTDAPDTFRKLARQRYRWDKSLVRFRLRKHIDLMYPDRNFSWRNFLSSLENIYFNLVLNIKWWIYIVQIVVFYTEWLGQIFVLNYLLYLMAGACQFAFAAILLRRSMRRRDWALVAFLPLVPIYMGIFIRLVRTYAYLMEFLFKASYFDTWNPWKTSSLARRNRL
jgi:cellulose synthase/poly-beta-1,6-N-acetylglucosamine synthase-like glycosyltransferase